MREEKYYKSGLVIGRFCPMHKEHEKIIDPSLAFCETTLVLIGSANEKGTLRNPFDIDTRIQIIKKAYSNISEKTLMIRGINDLKNELNNDYSWGDFVKSEVERHLGNFVELIVYGNDPVKRKWFSDEIMKNTAELYVPRNETSLSATLERGLLTIGDKEHWKNTVSENVYDMYDELREKLLNVPIYKEIYDSLRGDLSLDNYMKIYDEYVEIDKQRKKEELK